MCSALVHAGLIGARASHKKPWQNRDDLVSSARHLHDAGTAFWSLHALLTRHPQVRYWLPTPAGRAQLWAEIKAVLDNQVGPPPLPLL